jgi:DUF2075 family protein
MKENQNKKKNTKKDKWNIIEKICLIFMIIGIIYLIYSIGYILGKKDIIVTQRNDEIDILNEMYQDYKCKTSESKEYQEKNKCEIYKR